jgi:hypothetical protein
MKLNKCFLAALSVLAISTGFVSCSDDDEWDWSKEGSTIEMSQTRAFVLNEGAMSQNNASLTYFDWKTDATYANDLFMKQNGTAMGDVAQDIVVDDDNLYVIMSGSKLIYKLNGVGVRQSVLKIPSELGDPRYGVTEDGFLYVTCYGGYVAKIDTKTMSMAGQVKVGANPEYIVEEDGKLYCTCSGWGADKRVAVIDIKSFDNATYFDVMDNPDRIIEVDDHIFVQGYGADWSYPWGELNTKTGKFTQIGNCSSWAAYKNTLYLAFSETDWSTYATTTTFTSYNTKSGQLNKSSFLKNAPAALTSSSVYGLSVNEETGDIYVLTTDFVTNGHIYHFSSDGTFVKDFASTGVNPRKIVFLD